MDKLEHFVRVRTNQVEQSNYQYALRQFFDAAAANYTKKPTTVETRRKSIIMLKDFTISNLLDLNETIAAELFEGKTYPWEVLPEIGEFIMKLGPTLRSI